ncbi:MAG: hypothetical protein H7Y32_12865 [Chloroflexales bacterium]|nr:hypothetical protein [Chloroflexales bacterium]
MSDTTETQAGNTADAPAPTVPPTATDGGPTLTQAQFNAAIAKERRVWEQQQKKAADDAAAAARGEYEQIATSRAQEIAALRGELEQRDTRLTALADTLEQHVKGRLRALPEELRALAPEGDVAQRFAWLEQAEKAAAKLAQQPPAGTPPGPRNLGSVTTTGVDLAEQKRRNPNYSL